MGGHCGCGLLKQRVGVKCHLSKYDWTRCHTGAATKYSVEDMDNSLEKEKFLASMQTIVAALSSGIIRLASKRATTSESALLVAANHKFRL